jgi:hypothetical protein
MVSFEELLGEVLSTSFIKRHSEVGSTVEKHTPCERARSEQSVCPFNGLECEYVVCCDAVFELWLLRNGVVSYDADKMSCFRDLRGRY